MLDVVAQNHDFKVDICKITFIDYTRCPIFGTNDIPIVYIESNIWHLSTAI